MSERSMRGAMKQVAWSSALRTLASRFGEHTAVVDREGERLSYRALEEDAHALARHLLAFAPLPGTPIGVLLPNGLDAVRVSFGIRSSGAAEVPISWTATPEEIEWNARIAGFTRVIAPPARHRALRDVGLEPLDPVPLFNPVPQSARMELPAVDAHTASRILFTSGTTGKPKGVVYDSARRWIGEQLLAATLPFVPSPGAQVVLMTPFPHGASLLTYAWCSHGAEVVLLDGVDPARVRALLEAGRVEAIFAPPTVLAKLAAGLGTTHFPGVRCVFTGTQPLTPTLYRKARMLFGPVVRITYGKTECTNPITVLPPADVEACFGNDVVQVGACVGWPGPGVEIRIDRQEDAVDGEVLLRAMHQSNGLLGPDGFIPHDPDDWHRTGDLGHIDPRGQLVLTGRIADVIKTGGYRVNPDEIETALGSLASCDELCVTSIASDYWGEIIVAVAGGARAGWIDEARERVGALSRHKQPRLHVALDSLPRNPQGKVSRKRVAASVLQGHVLDDGPYPTLQPREPA